MEGFSRVSSGLNRMGWLLEVLLLSNKASNGQQLGREIGEQKGRWERTISSMFNAVVGLTSNRVTKHGMHIVIEALIEVSVTVEVTL